MHQHAISSHYQTINPLEPLKPLNSMLSRYKILDEYDRTLLLIKTLCRSNSHTSGNQVFSSILSLIIELEEKLALRKREFELSDLVVFETLKKKKKHYKGMAKRMKVELAKANERE